MSEDTDTSEFVETLTETFSSECGADEETAAEAAERVAAFRDDFDAELTVAAVGDALAEAPYEAFRHVFDFAVGHLAAEIEDCTDSREYRLDGFDELAADESIGA